MRTLILKINEQCRLLNEHESLKESTSIANIKQKTKEIIDSICQIEESIKAKELNVRSYFASLEFDSKSSSGNQEALINVQVSDQDFRLSLGMITEIETNQAVMKRRGEELNDILK